MNANELADELERLYQQDIIDGVADLSMPESATMLRQQQNKIEDLKSANRFIQNFAEEQHKRAVALEMRELTNEEISDIRDQFFAPKDCNIYTFARALLKKAQEND